MRKGNLSNRTERELWVHSEAVFTRECVKVAETALNSTTIPGGEWARVIIRPRVEDWLYRMSGHYRLVLFWIGIAYPVTYPLFSETKFFDSFAQAIREARQKSALVECIITAEARLVAEGVELLRV